MRTPGPRSAVPSPSLELGRDWRGNLDDRPLEGLRERFSPENVQVVY